MRQWVTIPAMSFDTIRQEITSWDETALRRLIAYAVVLQDRKSGQLGAELAHKFDDRKRARRVDWAKVDEILARVPANPPLPGDEL